MDDMSVRREADAERAYTIHLYRDDLHEQYCGSYWIYCDTSDHAAEMAAANCGYFRDPDNGKTGRGFFFADELSERADEARRVTGAYVVTA